MCALLNSMSLIPKHSPSFSSFPIQNDDDSDDDAAAGRTRGDGLQTMTNSSEEIDQSSTLGVDAVSRRFGAVASSE
jgi:hypothetical protein